MRQKLKILLSTPQVTSCTDVDECSEGRHTCHPSSTCRNTLGGSVVINFSPFFCVVKLSLPGMRAHVQTLEAHISAPQVAFSRERNISMGENSQLETVWNCNTHCRSEWRDGCNICSCDSGRATCSPMSCDCDQPGVDPGCCPQCQAGATCPHQVRLVGKMVKLVESRCPGV